MRKFGLIKDLLYKTYDDYESVYVYYKDEEYKITDLIYQYNPTISKSEADGFRKIDPTVSMSNQGNGSGSGVLVLDTYNEICNDDCETNLCFLEKRSDILIPDTSISISSSWSKPNTLGLADRPNIGSFDPLMKGRLIIKNPCSQLFTDIVNKECFWQTNVNTDGCNSNQANSDEGGSNKPNYKTCQDEHVCDILGDGSIAFAIMFTERGNNNDLCNNVQTRGGYPDYAFERGKCGFCVNVANYSISSAVAFDLKLNWQQEYALSFWFSDIQRDGRESVILTNYNQYRLGSFFAGIKDNKWWLKVSDGTSSGTFEEYSIDISQYLDGEWHHAIIQANRGRWDLYIDRNLVGTYNTNVQPGWDSTSNGEWLFGGSRSNPYIGKQFGFRFFFKDLTQEDRNKLYYEMQNEV